MNLERFLLHSLCALALVGCAQKEQSNTNPNLLRAQETLDSLYQNYSQPDGNLLRENYPFDQQNTVTYLASEEQANMPNQYSYLWPYSGTFSAVNALLEATGQSKYKSCWIKKYCRGWKSTLIPVGNLRLIHHISGRRRCLIVFMTIMCGLALTLPIFIR